MYTGLPPHISHLRAFGCDCSYYGKKTAAKGPGIPGLFLGYSQKSPRGSYIIEEKGKRTKVRVDSGDVLFDEHQVLPKFIDKTSTSHISSDVDTLVRDQHCSPPVATTRGDITDSNITPPNLPKHHNKRKCSIHFEDQVSIEPTAKPIFRVQELVDDKRVLAPGPKFIPKNGNAAKYIVDRLQTLVGLTPYQTQTVMYRTKSGGTKQYTLGDCKYDLEGGKLILVHKDSNTGTAAVYMATRLTPKKGTLSEGIASKMIQIEDSITGRVYSGSRMQFEPRRDIDGGITSSTPMDDTRGHIKPSQPYLRDPTATLTRDEKVLIIKADHLGLVTGVDLNLQAPDGTEMTYTIVDDETESFVYNPTTRLTECVHLVTPDEDVPQTFAKILKHSERKEWLECVLKEYVNLASKGTWRIAALPAGRRMLGCRLVLRRKVDKDGNLTSRKGRCVIQGYNQEEGVDYQRLFQPVAALSTLRNQCCIALHNGEDLKSWDFEQAFVQSNMDTEMYIRWPPGLRGLADKVTGKHTALLVKKAQYGARQSPRCWGLKLHKFLLAEGFRRSDTDSCLYLLDRIDIKTNSKIQIALVVYVDDLTARANLECPLTKHIYDKFVKHMQAEFVVEDRGICDSMLGYKIDYDKANGTLKLTQKSCLLGLLQRTNLDECERKLTPAPPGIKPSSQWCPDLSTIEGKQEAATMKELDYGNRVGATLWLSRGSRPETSWTVGMLSRWLSRPGQKHYDMCTHLIKYLSTTRDRGIVYRRSKDGMNLKAFVDGDWLTDYGDDTENRRCCTGYALLLCGAAVSWRSFKQQRVAGSSTESEYYSLWAAVREVMHFRRQLKECGFEQLEPTIINEDNQSVQRLSEDVVESSRTRHWDKEWHQLREEFDRGTMRTVYVDTKLNAADVLSKSLATADHQRHTDTLCGQDWNADEDLIYQMSLPIDRRSEYALEAKSKVTQGKEESVEKISPASSAISIVRPGSDNHQVP
jgi:hypothetical protein